MCYSIPGKVVGCSGRFAEVDYFGERRVVANEIGAKPGEYVYAQGGFAIERISEQEAVPILRTWQRLFFKLKEIDARISNERFEVDSEIGAVLQKAAAGEQLTRQDILKLLTITDVNELKALYSTANAVRMAELGNSCCVHGIIEFSNYCKNDCAYCGLRAQNLNLMRYRMQTKEIIKVAARAVKGYGFKALVLQSGEDLWYSTERLVQIIKGIIARAPVLLFVSVGERGKDCYQAMYEAGARGVLLRFETSNPKLFKRLHQGKKLRRRISLLKHARKLGYVLATGSLIGLPGQTVEDIASDIILTKGLDAEMWSFGPLIPHPCTPLAGTEKISIDAMLKVLAASRLYAPKAKILVTTALETLHPEGRRAGLLAGANSLMLNLTPAEYKRLYSTYPNRAGVKEDIPKQTKAAVMLLHSLGRAPTDFSHQALA